MLISQKQNGITRARKRQTVSRRAKCLWQLSQPWKLQIQVCTPYQEETGLDPISKGSALPQSVVCPKATIPMISTGMERTKLNRDFRLSMSQIIN
ncbi:hypothetical protein Y1Q_0023455 [Alligator mississippiensis]|uniref:Uncharacterized protein n=1 Tax=Alligator mississippiensis TaxID=8496 RepID=A0A151NQ48_ALLMI|nr:hypothetical protein Y1Q_0023455 [Alligator mississippiensis]